jgi:hypothetical protein
MLGVSPINPQGAQQLCNAEAASVEPSISCVCHSTACGTQPPLCGRVRETKQQHSSVESDGPVQALV